MKTQKINLKKLAATAFAALFIATGSFTQSDAGNLAEMELVSHNNLETIMNLTEESIRYTAPSIPVSEACSAEFERLEWLAAATEASTLYEAPEVNDADVTAEFERLEWLASATEASIRYNAPEDDMISENDNTFVNEIVLADNNK